MIPKEEWIKELREAIETKKNIKINITPIEDVESPQQWFVRQIWENITFTCAECGGTIQRIMIAENSWRWTCKDCQRDFGYDSPEPLKHA